MFDRKGFITGTFTCDYPIDHCIGESLRNHCSAQAENTLNQLKLQPTSLYYSKLFQFERQRYFNGPTR